MWRYYGSQDHNFYEAAPLVFAEIAPYLDSSEINKIAKRILPRLKHKITNVRDHNNKLLAAIASRLDSDALSSFIQSSLMNLIEPDYQWRAMAMEALIILAQCSDSDNLNLVMQGLVTYLARHDIVSQSILEKLPEVIPCFNPEHLNTCVELLVNDLKSPVEDIYSGALGLFTTVASRLSVAQVNTLLQPMISGLALHNGRYCEVFKVISALMPRMTWDEDNLLFQTLLQGLNHRYSVVSYEALQIISCLTSYLKKHRVQFNDAIQSLLDRSWPNLFNSSEDEKICMALIPLLNEEQLEICLSSIQKSLSDNSIDILSKALILVKVLIPRLNPGQLCTLLKPVVIALGDSRYSVRSSAFDAFMVLVPTFNHEELDGTLTLIIEKLATCTDNQHRGIARTMLLALMSLMSLTKHLNSIQLGKYIAPLLIYLRAQPEEVRLEAFNTLMRLKDRLPARELREFIPALIAIDSDRQLPMRKASQLCLYLLIKNQNRSEFTNEDKKQIQELVDVVSNPNVSESARDLASQVLNSWMISLLSRDDETDMALQKKIHDSYLFLSDRFRDLGSDAKKSTHCSSMQMMLDLCIALRSTGEESTHEQVLGSCCSLS